jgi:hypothetical protein
MLTDAEQTRFCVDERSSEGDTAFPHYIKTRANPD